MPLTYLNGKIGDIRSFDDSGNTLRFGVHFEDESIPPKSVRGANLRILFDLPEERKGSMLSFMGLVFDFQAFDVNMQIPQKPSIN
jgi:hypothetical protein